MQPQSSNPRPRPYTRLIIFLVIEAFLTLITLYLIYTMFYIGTTAHSNSVDGLGFIFLILSYVGFLLPGSIAGLVVSICTLKTAPYCQKGTTNHQTGLVTIILSAINLALPPLSVCIWLFTI